MAREETGTGVMIIGLVLAGMILGAVAATTWFVAGGSVLLALGFYGLVAAFSILGAASTLYLLAERRQSAQLGFAEGLRPTR